LPCSHHHPLVFINKEQRSKKNGAKQSSLDEFTVLLLTFFSMKLTFWLAMQDHDILSHRWIFASHHLLPLMFITTKRRAKKNSEKPFSFHEFTVLSLTFFYLIDNIGPNARSMISKPEDCFVPHHHRQLLLFITIERHCE